MLTSTRERLQQDVENCTVLAQRQGLFSGNTGGSEGTPAQRLKRVESTAKCQGQSVSTHSVRNASEGWQWMQNKHIATAVTVRHSLSDTVDEEEEDSTGYT